MKIAARISLTIFVIVTVIWSIEHREDDAERHQQRQRLQRGLSGALEIALPASPF